MKISKWLSLCFAVLALCAAAAGICLSLRYANAQPVLVRVPEEARQQAEALMEAVVSGDYGTVSSLLRGQPDLGLDRDPADDTGKLFWDALEASRSYTFTGGFRATDSGIAIDVTLTCLDLSSVTQNLRQRAQTLLEQRVAAAEDTSEIYVEGGEYREDFVMAVLSDAAADALAEDARLTDWNLTLNFVFDEGRWWILPDQALLTAISGGITK